MYRPLESQEAHQKRVEEILIPRNLLLTGPYWTEPGNSFSFEASINVCYQPLKFWRRAGEEQPRVGVIQIYPNFCSKTFIASSLSLTPVHQVHLKLHSYEEEARAQLIVQIKQTKNNLQCQFNCTDMIYCIWFTKDVEDQDKKTPVSPEVHLSHTDNLDNLYLGMCTRPRKWERVYKI